MKPHYCWNRILIGAYSITPNPHTVSQKPFPFLPSSIQSTIWFSFVSSPLIFLFSLFSPMVLWNPSLSLWTKSSSNGGAEVRERRFMEEQGNGFADPPQGPFQSRRRPSPPPPGSSFRRRRRRRRRLLLYHLRPVAPTVQRFPQGVLAFFFYFLSQKRYFFWFWKFEKNMCDG